MRVLVHLEHSVDAFRVSREQIEWLRASASAHEIEHVTDESRFLERLPDADAAVVWDFEPEWYARAPRLRCVFTPSAGRERIATDPHGRARRVFGSFHGKIMAESLLAMILFELRRFEAALVARAAHAWDKSPYQGARGLAGQVVLIVGMGEIGKHCARLLRACGAIVHGLKRDASKPVSEVDRLFGSEALLEAVGLADHVVCILPGDTNTDRLLDERAIAAMKPTAYVYNLGRGNAIDTEALSKALRAGAIQGAFLDVVPEEPLPPDSPLWSVPNLHLTPHASAMRADYLDLYFEELARHLALGSAAR